MIDFMGADAEDMDVAYDEAEAFFAYVEDPDANLTATLAVEEFHGVTL
ncbi:hypothetical protein ACFU6R_03335 [Streptomyces sp. NPDC057499]